MGAGSGNVGKGEKLRVLEKKGDYVKVRDAQGNEGFVPADVF
jgi:uncharacterized protein YgiM (DUF1202 family)